MHTQVLVTWEINNRNNLLLLDALDSEGLESTVSPRGGNTVGYQFAHMHYVRVLKLEKSSSELAQGLSKVEKSARHDRTVLVDNLSASAKAISELLAQGIEAGGKLKGWKRGVVPFLGYLIAHESHHRGNILLTLKQCGHKLPRAVQYRIWSWNQI